MRNKEVMVGILIVSFAGLLLISACGKSSSTAPSDFTISVPEDTAFTTPKGVVNYSVAYRDHVVSVMDADGKPRQGIKLRVIAHGSGFGSFYTDRTLTTPRPDPYEDKTDDNGRILVNYASAAFTSLSTEQTFTLGYRVQSGVIGAEHTDTVTVSAR